MRVGLQVLAGGLADVLERHRAHALRVALDVVVAEPEVLDLAEEAGELAGRVEAQREVAGQVVLRGVELLLGGALVGAACAISSRTSAIASAALSTLVCSATWNGPGSLLPSKRARHRVGEAALGADGLHEARVEAAAAEHVVHQQDREVVRIRARDADLAEHDARPASPDGRPPPTSRAARTVACARSAARRSRASRRAGAAPSPSSRAVGTSPTIAQMVRAGWISSR